jgi:hypothetical protein
MRRMAAFVGVSLSSAGRERFTQLIAMQRDDRVAEIVGIRMQSTHQLNLAVAS